MSAYGEKPKSNLLKKCLNKWYWFVPCAALALAAAWYLLKCEQSIWSVSGSVIVQEDNSKGGQLPEESIIQGLAFKNRGNLDKQIQILKSRHLMERVVDSLDIDILYLVERRFKTEELYKRSPVKVASVDDKDRAYGRALRIKQIDASRFALIKGENDTLYHNYGVPFVSDGVTYSLIRDTSVAQEQDVLQISFMFPQKVAAWYAGNLTFQKQAQSNVLAVSANDQAPEKVVDIIYKLVDVYNAFVQEEKNKVATQSLNFINDRLTDLSSELFSVEGAQASFKSVTEVTTDVDASAERYIQQLSAAETARTEIGNTRSTLVNLQEFLSDFNNQFEPIPSFGDLGGISFAPLIDSYNRLIAARQAKLVYATPRHPEVVQAEKDLSKMRSNILSGVRLALTDLSNRERDLLEKTAPVERKVQALPFAQKKLDEIGREKSVKEELVIYMLTKREETAIGLATQVDNTRILDEPVISEVPISPSAKQYYGLALLLGLAFPTGLVYLLDRMNDKVGTSDEVKALSPVPFLGDVAYAKSERNRLITANSRSAIAEMFRLIRTNLQFIGSKDKQKVVLITSNESGDGKTFISSNLAVALSLTNKKTVVLELDLRKPRLTSALTKVPPTVGITNFLVGEKELEDIVQKLEGYANLYLISSGPKPPNPAELIMSDRMEELVAKLKKEFDYIVMDTPPTGLVADAFLLNKFASNSIFVICAGKTKKDDLSNINELCENGKLNNPGIVLNGVKMPKRYGYYY